MFLQIQSYLERFLIYTVSTQLFSKNGKKKWVNEMRIRRETLATSADNRSYWLYDYNQIINWKFLFFLP